MANFKLSQLENLDIIDNDTYVMVVKNGKNYKVTVNAAIEQNLNINDISDQISNIELVNETQSNQIIKLENTINNINNNVASSDDANKSFDEIFIY